MFPTPWTLELRQRFPYGFIIKAANGNEVIQEDAICSSSAQKTRKDNELGVGFRFKNRIGESFTTREEAVKMVAEQTAKAQLIVAAVNESTAILSLAQRLEALENTTITWGA